MGRLTVVTGIPGTRVQLSLAKFIDFARQSHDHNVSVFSIDAVLQERARPLVTEHFPELTAATVVQAFMLPRPELRRVWRETWSEVLVRVDEALKVGDVLLTLHLAYFHQLTREYIVAADRPQLVDDLKARDAGVVVFVDDVYDCHQSLIAGGSAAGMMAIPDSVDRVVLDVIQILDWRSVEVMLSDSLASALEKQLYIFAVKHPIQTFYDLLYSGKRVVYLSHPIAEPRRRHDSGQKDEAEAFVNTMAQIVARIQANSTVIEPTAIDELRFMSGSGNLSTRWPFHNDNRTLLYVPPVSAPPGAKPFSFPAGWDSDEREAIQASGLVQNLVKAIGEQINARDHGLVEQASLVACYRPVYEGNASRGVEEELKHHGRLVSLGLRRAEASIVFSPQGDQLLYPRRRLVEMILPAWITAQFLVGAPEALESLKRTIADGSSAYVAGLLSGDADSLMSLAAECSVTIQPNDFLLAGAIPGSSLGATEIARRQATAGVLAAQAKSASESLYLDELTRLGIVRIVESEPLFYTALEEKPVLEGSSTNG